MTNYKGIKLLNKFNKDLQNVLLKEFLMYD